MILHGGNLYSYDDSWELELEPLTVRGQTLSVNGISNFDVSMFPNVKSGHHTQTPDPIYNHPTVYWNIPYVIANGTHYPSTSQNPDHLARMGAGHTEVYELDKFFEVLDTNLGWEVQNPQHTMIVPVFYPYDGSTNKVLSYYAVPKSRGRST